MAGYERKMRKLKWCDMFRACAWLIAMMIVPVGANAATIDPIIKPLELGGGWETFRFDAGYKDGAWLDPDANPKAGPLHEIKFAVKVKKKATLQVVDGFRWGDIFEVFANGESLGKTSRPGPLLDYNDDRYAIYKDNPLTFNYTEVLDDNKGLWSRGEFDLDPGHYLISGRVVEQPENRGRAGLRLVAKAGSDHPVVPLPGSLPLLMGAGAFFVVAARRAKKTRG